MAFFPPVPESWDVKVEGNTIEYTSPTNPKTQKTPKTKVTFNYSKKTNDKDAKTLIDEYAKSHECNDPKEQGKGFYTTACPNIQRDTVIVGEPNNMYTIELSGEISAEAASLVNIILELLEISIPILN